MMLSPNQSASQPRSIQNKSSYAHVTQQVQVPTKEQAIVIDAIEGISVQEYVIAVGKLIGPANIRFVSRISHGRICLYMNSKESADKLTESGKKITIGTLTLEIRPLISKAKRIIISNACPIIPNDIIIEELAKINITPCSQITYIRAGINDAGFSHVLSFRRQMYINPDDFPKLPPSIAINYDSTTYYIYLSGEKLSCFLCREEGHLAKFCKNLAPNSSAFIENSELNSSNPSPNNTTVSIAHSQEYTFPALNNTTTVTTEEKATVMPPHQSNKRLLPSSTGSSTSSTTAHSTMDSFKIAQPKVKQSLTTKKPKVASSRSVTSVEVEAQLVPAKAHIISKVSSYPLSYEDLVDFLVTTYGKSDIPAIAKHFTVDTHLLINMLEETNSHLLDKNLIHRIGRIIIRLSSNEKSCLSDTQSERSIDDTEDSDV